MKPNEIIAVLRQCAGNDPSVCQKCSVYSWNAGCLELLHKEAAELIERLTAERRWIPVTERLPEIGDRYVVAVKFKYDHEKQYSYDTDVATYTFEGGYIDDCWDTYNDWDEGQQFLHVTHWIALPEPPKEDVHED